MLSQLLFEPTPLPTSRGCPIRFDIDEPSIELMTGTLEERVASLLHKCGYPMTVKEIAAGMLSADAWEDSVQIRVVDNGPGVPADVQSKLFELFALTSKPESMGLGLWLCAYIVQKHQGRISYEDNPQGGAQFFISRPIKPRMP